MTTPKIISPQGPRPTEAYPRSDSGSKPSQGIGNSSLGHKLRQMITNNGSSLSDKCMTIDEMKLKKAKVSASYGLFHVHYGVILPIKAMLFGLTLEQELNLDLYRIHIALCAEVDKVKSAFKAYRSAQETADTAPLQSETKRKDARIKAQHAGEKLVKGHDDLIKLAIKQAEIHRLDKDKYLADIHNELSKDYILQTVNQLRARKEVENPLLMYGDFDPAGIRDIYCSFVMDFISHVQAAKHASGGYASSQEISKAFIRGLASIPELQGETLSDLYDLLNNDQEFVDYFQTTQLKSIKSYFMKQLEVLKDKQEDVTPEELASIHYNGVALSSILPQLTAENLNTLKKVNKERKETVAALLQTQSEFGLDQQEIGETSRYTFEDVEAFFSDIGEEMEKELLAARNDKTAVGRFAREALQIRASIDMKSRELAPIEAGDNDRRVAKECQEAIESAFEEIARLDGVIREQRTRLNEFKSDIPPEEIFKNEWLKKLQYNNINSKRIILDKIEQKAAKRDEQACEDKIRQLKDEIRALKVNPIIRLSAEEVAQIGKYFNVDRHFGKSFGIEKPFTPKSRIAKQLLKTNEAIAKTMKEKCVSECASHIEKLKQLISQLKDQPFTLTRDGQFVVNDNLFGEENGWVQRGIKAQISVNLAIAIELTRAVAQEVVDQKDKHYQSQQGSEKKMNHMQKRVGQRILPLAIKLKTADFNPKDVLKAIEERIEAPSSPVASPSAPRRVQERLSAELATLSDDAQEWSDAGIPDVGTWYEEADKSISKVSKETSPLIR
ncbi:MAG TPA: hypothetical protein VFU89_08095 [Rhabdochlamydiaceae bacterium]|nr:hypothetical protein [Rhabdochlamydiaceae bacterium]